MDKNPSGTSQAPEPHFLLSSGALPVDLIPTPLQKFNGLSGDLFPLADSTKKKNDELVSWARTQVSTLGLEVKDMNSFANGEVLLGLLHKVDPVRVNFKKFDKTNTLKTLSTVFKLAEEILGIPNLIQPTEFLQNTDPRAIMMYISMFKMKIDADHMSTTQAQIESLSKLVLECASDVEDATEQFSSDCTKLRSLAATVDVGEKEQYFAKRVTLMDSMIREALDMVEDLEERNGYWQKKTNC
eukprot:TRINITY_DN6869_c0_g1_i1.p1 TRINITY_DN6869_c0_g1~~TRINITY_DN6869_c0_g1_i1.p1  ORF type:complete len:242 (-),score=52.56 TRINITY_DN6869_c0_g1_i1:260-985(-)